MDDLWDSNLDSAYHPPSEPKTGRPSAGDGEVIVLLMLASVQFTSIVDFMVVMPLGPQLMRTLGIKPAQFGLIVSSYTISAGIAGFLASSFLDRFSRKSAFLTLYTGFLVGTLLCGLVSTYPALWRRGCVTGAFGGILGGMSLAIIGDVFPEERRGRATGHLDVGVRHRLGGRSADRALPGYVVWLERPLRDPRRHWALPVLLGGLRVLPPLRDHLHHGPHVHPLRQIRETFSHPNHLRAFALIVTLMLGGFAVIPYIAAYLVANDVVPEKNLPWVYVTGGILTLVGAPVIGRLADHYGKLRVYRVVAIISALLMIVVTNLPHVSMFVAVAVVGLLMLSNAGRMVAAMAMVTGSVEPRRRGGFMSANSAMQHLSTGLGSALGGIILVKAPDGTLENFDKVGMIAVASTLLSLWLAGLVRPAKPESRILAGKPPVDEILDDPLSAAELL